MSRVSPFRGLLFDRSRVGPLDALTTPLYDVITPAELERYRGANPYNVAQVEFGREARGEGDPEAQYTSAGSTFRSWRDEGVLRLDPVAAYYPYEMRFRLGGRGRRIRGLICQVELEEWGGSVIPHEETMAGPIEDRLLLMRATRANLSAVYALFPGPARRCGTSSSASPPIRRTSSSPTRRASNTGCGGWPSLLRGRQTCPDGSRISPS